MKQQTAVEWFFEELQNMQYFIGNDMLEALKQAKELEKQQIIDAHENGHGYYDVNGIDANQYYNETFNKL